MPGVVADCPPPVLLAQISMHCRECSAEGGADEKISEAGWDMARSETGDTLLMHSTGERLRNCRS